MTTNENEDNFDVIYKLVLVGDSGVGKTNIMLRYLNKEFNQNTKATVGVEFGSKNIKIENKIVKGQIWDTAGQERYRAITSAYYKGAHGAFVVFDVTQRETFDAVDRWVNDLRNNTDYYVNRYDIKLNFTDSTFTVSGPDSDRFIRDYKLDECIK